MDYTAKYKKYKNKYISVINNTNEADKINKINKIGGASNVVVNTGPNNYTIAQPHVVALYGQLKGQPIGHITNTQNGEFVYLAQDNNKYLFSGEEFNLMVELHDINNSPMVGQMHKIIESKTQTFTVIDTSIIRPTVTPQPHILVQNSNYIFNTPSHAEQVLINELEINSYIILIDHCMVLYGLKISGNKYIIDVQSNTAKYVLHYDINYKNTIMTEFTQLLQTLPANHQVKQYAAIKRMQHNKQKYEIVDFPALKCPTPNSNKIIELYNRYTLNKKPSANPQFILLIGGPCAGKTSSIGKILSNPTNAHLGSINDYIYVDIDDIRMESKEYRENINGIHAARTMPHLKQTPWIWGQSTGTIGQYQYVTENGYTNNNDEFVASKNSVGDCKNYTWPLTWKGQKALLYEIARKNYNIIYNTICADAQQCTGILDDIIKINPNYKITMIFIQIDVETAVIRAQGRAIKEGRFTPPQFIRDDYARLWNPANINTLKKYAALHNAAIDAYDNNGATLQKIAI